MATPNRSAMNAAWCLARKKDPYSVRNATCVASGLSRFNGRVEMLELDTSISGRKAPVDFDGLLIACSLPGLYLPFQLRLSADTAFQGMSREDRKFYFCHI